MYIISIRSNFHRHFKSRKRVVVLNCEERENKIQFLPRYDGGKIIISHFWMGEILLYKYTLLVLLLET